MTFRPYMHVEKFGNVGVDGIELGKVYVFPKLDGTNASTWYDDRIRAASRNRELDTAHPGNQDNHGFAEWLHSGSHLPEDPTSQPELISSFLLCNKQLRLYGEWLVPHTFKGYRQDAWRNFYVFDVFNDETQQYLSYDIYAPILENYGITYIPPLATIKNGSLENFQRILSQNKYLCPDDGEPGEGIVIKNYDYYNKFGQQIWAKIIRQEFKDAHHRLMGPPEINNALVNEERLLDKALTGALIDKTVAKIIGHRDPDHLLWSAKYIPELFERCFRDIIVEELYSCIHKEKLQQINFKTLKALMINRIKEMKKGLF